MEHHATTTGFEGNTLGKYRLLAELGRGGMAEVYLAVSQGPAGFNKLVVLKQLSPSLAEDPEFLAMFLDEARLAARLSHPNVVQTNEVGHDGSRYFIAMEYLEGQPVNRVVHRLGREGGFPVGMHLRILADALSGLHHAHELTDYDGTPLEVVHRDATPHNLFITYDGQVKVVDFGIAKALNSSAETRTGVLKGKVAYMSPEQARGEPVDRRADIFSVGVMLWEALARRRLWKGLSDVAMLHHIVSGQVPPPSSVRANIHPALDAVCLRAVAYHADSRYRTAQEMLHELEHAIVASGEPGTVKEAGRLVAQYFDEERRRIRSLIEEQLGAARALSTSEYRSLALPVLVEQLPGSPSVSADLHSDPARPTVTPSGTPNFPTPPSGPSVGTPYALSAGQTDPSLRPRPGLNRGVLVGVAGLVAGLVAVGLFAFSGRDSSNPPAPAATTSAAPESTAPAPAAATVLLAVKASPADTKLFLDERPLPGNPFEGSFPVDDKVHLLRAEAPGRTTETRELRLDRAQSLELTLDEDKGAKEPKTPKKSGTGSAATPAAVPTPEPSETSDGLGKPPPKPKRVIDTNNPYGK
jgi:serine/threonine protein kinase